MTATKEQSIAPVVRATKRGIAAEESDRNSKKKSHQHAHGNIMSDPRVWRGPTFDLYKKPKSDQDPKPVAGRFLPAYVLRAGDHQRVFKENISHRTKENDGFRPGDRGDLLALVLEEITDRPLEPDNFMQIELARVRPDTPPFSPATTSKDATTDIRHNDLFSFDREVKPLLEILIGQSVEQALLETAQEEEDLVNTMEHRLHQEYRNVHRAEEQRLTDQRKRHNEEKKRRLEERSICEEEAKQSVQKAEVVEYANEFLESLMPNVYHQLQTEGYFDNAVQRELQTYFLPWVCEHVGTALDDYTAASLVTQVLLKKALLDMREELAHAMHMAKHPAYVPITFQQIHPQSHRHHNHKHNIPAITLTEGSLSQ